MAKLYVQLWEIAATRQVGVVSIHANDTARDAYYGEHASTGPRAYAVIHGPLRVFYGSVRFRGENGGPVQVATGWLDVPEETYCAAVQLGDTAMALAAFAFVAPTSWPGALQAYQVYKHGEECLSGVEACS